MFRVFADLAERDLHRSPRHHLARAPGEDPRLSHHLQHRGLAARLVPHHHHARQLDQSQISIIMLDQSQISIIIVLDQSEISIILFNQSQVSIIMFNQSQLTWSAVL